jgi:hypothetical protein
MKIKLNFLIIVALVIILTPSIIGRPGSNETEFKEDYQFFTSNLGVKLIRPKPSYLYLFDTIEIPISSQYTIIIGDITCVAEQVAVYPYTVKWEFIDWRYGFYKNSSDSFNSPFWRYTYSNFNLGNLQITASFENTAGTVMSNDTIIVKKFL